MIHQIPFDDEDELNRKIHALKEEFVIKYGGQLKGSLRVINIFSRGNPNAPGRKILPMYEAWVEIGGK